MKEESVYSLNNSTRRLRQKVRRGTSTLLNGALALQMKSNFRVHRHSDSVALTTLIVQILIVKKVERNEKIDQN